MVCSVEWEVNQWFKFTNRGYNRTLDKPYKTVGVVKVPGKEIRLTYINDKGKEDWLFSSYVTRCEAPEEGPVDDFIGKVFITNSGQHRRIIESFHNGEYRLVAVEGSTINTIYRTREKLDKNFTELIGAASKFSYGDRVIRIKGPIKQAAKLLTTYTVDCVSTSDGRLRLDEVGGAYNPENWILESEVTKEEPEIPVHGDCIVEGTIDFKDVAPNGADALTADGSIVDYKTSITPEQKNILLALERGPQWQSYNAQTETYSTQPEEETIMSNKIILAVEVSSTAAFATVPAFDVIYGQKVSEMEEQDLFNALKMIDSELEVLKDLGTGKASKRVTAKTAKLKEAKEQVILAIDALPEEGEDES